MLKKRSQFGCWLLLLFIFLLFTFFFLVFSSFVYFLSLHTLSAQTYLITFWLQGFHDFFLIVFFLPVSLKKIMISWYSWFFLTASMLILRGPSFCFRCGFAGMDLVFIYMTHSCGVKYFFQSAADVNLNFFLFGDFSDLQQIQPLAGLVSVLVRYWPDLRSVCPLSQFLDYSI